MSKETGIRNLNVKKTISGDEVVKTLQYHRTVPEEIQHIIGSANVTETFKPGTEVDDVREYVQLRKAEDDKRFADAQSKVAADRIAKLKEKRGHGQSQAAQGQGQGQPTQGQSK